MRRSHANMDNACPEAKHVHSYWKQQHGYDVPMDGSCLLEVQLSEEQDEPCRLLPQLCVWLSNNLMPDQQDSRTADLMAELRQTAGQAFC